MRSTLAVLIALAALAACGDKPEATPSVANVNSKPTQLPAAENPAPAPVVDPGKLKYVAVCQGCHGRNGAGQGPFPKLAGKPASELAGKLKDYRAGKQIGPQSSTMLPFAKALSDAEIDLIAAHLSGL